MKIIYSIALITLFFPTSSTYIWAKESTSNTAKINLYNIQQRANSFAECTDIFPDANPETTIQPTYINSGKWQLRQLCSDDFAVLYSGKTKTPLLVVEKLNQKILSKNISRTDDFFTDPRLPSQQRAKLSDYKGALDIDRGHLAPARNSASLNGMAQTFAFSNIVPQNANNNRNAWKKIEADTYKYAARMQSDVYVFTGVLFEKKEYSEKIGKNKIWKPSHLYKVVYHPEKNKSWAFVIANKPNQDIKQISYADFVQKTGIKFGFLEKSFQAQGNSILSNILTGAVFITLFDQLMPENIWETISQKTNQLWNGFLKMLFSWLKENDKNNSEE